jgi:hypothetical protein
VHDIAQKLILDVDQSVGHLSPRAVISFAILCVPRTSSESAIAITSCSSASLALRSLAGSDLTASSDSFVPLSRTIPKRTAGMTTQVSGFLTILQEICG